MKTRSIIKSLCLAVIAVVAVLFLYCGSFDTLGVDARVSLAFVLPILAIKPTTTSGDLKEDRKKIKGRLDELKKLATDENRAYTEDELKEFRTLEDSYERFSENIELLLVSEKRAAQQAGAAAAGASASQSEEREISKFSFTKTVRELQSKGVSGITGLEAELVKESQTEAREMGETGANLYLSNSIMNIVSRNSPMLQKELRTMSAQTGAITTGANTIATEKIGFFDALWNALVLEKLGVSKLGGLTANADLTGFGTAPVAYWAAELGTQSATDAATAVRSPRPKLLGSAMDISMLLRIQNPGLEAYFLDGMMKAMRVALEAAVINGDGSDKPTGILGTTGIQDVAIGTVTGGAPTYAKILELIQKVETAGADLAACKWLINPKTRAKLKTVSIDAGSGAMILPYLQYFGPGISAGIDGYETYSTANVPSTLTKGSSGAVCSAALFGDFSNVVVAQWGGIMLSVDEISAAMRRTGKYALTINMYCDSVTKVPGALGAIKDIITT